MPSERDKAFEVQIEDGVLVVRFTDAEITDEARIQQIGSELMDLCLRATGGGMLLSFEGVRSMSSAMIGKLVLLNVKAKSLNIDLKFCSISPNVLEVFRITQFPQD